MHTSVRTRTLFFSSVDQLYRGLSMFFLLRLIGLAGAGWAWGLLVPFSGSPVAAPARISAVVGGVALFVWTMSNRLVAQQERTRGRFLSLKKSHFMVL